MNWWASSATPTSKPTALWIAFCPTSPMSQMATGQTKKLAMTLPGVVRIFQAIDRIADEDVVFGDKDELVASRGNGVKLSTEAREAWVTGIVGIGNSNENRSG